MPKNPRNLHFKRSKKNKAASFETFRARSLDVLRRKKGHSYPIYHACGRRNPRGTSSGKPSLEIDQSFRPHFSLDAISLPRPAAEPAEAANQPPLHPRGLDSPWSYSRPAESGSRLIIRRVRLDSSAHAAKRDEKPG